MIERVWKTGRVAFVTALLAVAGCGGDEGGGSGASAGGESAPAASPVDPATVGHASGMVTFSGMAPAMAEIDMSDEAVCASKHAMTPTAETVIVGDGGGRANVFGYGKEGLEDRDFPTPTDLVAVGRDGRRRDGCSGHKPERQRLADQIDTEHDDGNYQYSNDRS